MNTYEDMLDLQAKGLATVSQNGDLVTFKYARKVMHDYLWKTDSKLLECRGHTYDVKTGELVVATPRKSFNYLEDGWWKDKPLDTPVIAYKKYNGFMACVSEHNGAVFASTTGSTKSDFVIMAYEMFEQMPGEFGGCGGSNTDLYEIVHPNDPHIVDEPAGAHYLGSRCKQTGVFTPYGKPEDTYLGTLKGILAIAEVNTGEGFMVYDLHNDPDRLAPAKVKTPYYVGKKKLMRLSKNNSEFMYNSPMIFADSLPLMWQDVPQKILAAFTKEEWLETNEMQRRLFLESLKGV